MASMVDSYRFLDSVAKRVMQHWSGLRAAKPSPWTPLAKPLPPCTIALVSAAALALNRDRPFDVQIERLDPWFSDPSYRVVPRNTWTGEVQSFHLHINPAFAKQDCRRSHRSGNHQRSEFSGLMTDEWRRRYLAIWVDLNEQTANWTFEN